MLYGGGPYRGSQDFVGAIPTLRASFEADGAIAVVLSVRNEARLLYTARKLQETGVGFVLVTEPDLNGQATAIGVMPCPRELVGRALKDAIVFCPEVKQ